MLKNKLNYINYFICGSIHVTKHLLYFMEPTGLSVRGGVIDFIMFINGYLIVCLDLLWRVCHIGYMILVDFLSFIDTFIMNINVIVYYCY